MHGNNTHLYDQDIARWGQATAVDKDLVVQIGSSDDTRPIEIPHFLAAQHLRPLVLHHLRARCRPAPAGSGALVARGWGTGGQSCGRPEGTSASSCWLPSGQAM